MIEICLNPDNQMLGGEVFESVDSDVHADSRDSHEMALRTADKLVKELKPRPGQQTMSYQLLQNMLQVMIMMMMIMMIIMTSAAGHQEQGQHREGAAGVPLLLQSKATALHCPGVVPHQTYSEDTQVSPSSHTTQGNIQRLC